MLIPVSNWELDSVPVVTMRGRKGEMCVGREKRTGNMPSRTAVLSSHRAACQSVFGDDPWAGAALAGCCPLRACAHQTTPLPRLLKHLPDLFWWLSARTSSQATLHCQPIQAATHPSAAQAKNHSSKANMTQLQPGLFPAPQVIN